jgi:hypothetical protein
VRSLIRPAKHGGRPRAAKELNVPPPSKSVQRILVELAVGHHIALHCLERPLAMLDKIRSIAARARAEAFKR